MKGAVIDLGTNTFSLLIFEGNDSNKTIIATDKDFVNLGKDGINSNTINPVALDRAYNIIEKYIGICDVKNVPHSNICAFGTSALRNADNASELIDRVHDNLNVKISLINGYREAELVYEAVKSIHPFSDNLSCIMDIGGGSTEFTITKKDKIIKYDSYKIGLSRLTQMKELSDPLSKDDIRDIENFLSQKVNNFFDDFELDDMVGTGGSYETYFQMLYRTLDVDFSRSHHLPMNELMEVLDYLIHSSLQERTDNPLVVNYRKNMINVAALKTKWTLEQMKAKRCYFSPASLKEGIMLTEFGKLKVGN